MKRIWIVGSAVALAVCVLVGLGIAAGSDAKSEVKPCMGMKVVRHVVCFKFKDTATAEQIETVTEAFANLKNEIPFIVGFESGANTSPEKLNKGFNHCYILTFKNLKDRDAYLPHPAHKAFGGKLRGLIDDVFVIDIETPMSCCGGCAGAATQ